MRHFTLIAVALATLCAPAWAQNRVKNLSTSNSRLQVETLQQAEQPVQVNRLLLAGYNTLCLPMSLSAEQLQEAAKDVQVERLAAIRQEGTTLSLYFIDCTAEGIEAGEPYLIYSPKLQTMRALSTKSTGVSTLLRNVSMSDELGNRVSFGSSWEALSGNARRYGIPAKQNVEVLESVLRQTTEEQTFLPTRCGFTWEEQSSTATDLQVKHVASLDAIETGISKLTAADATADVYDAKGVLVQRQARVGQALKTLPRGIYVIGGEKVIVR